VPKVKRAKVGLREKLLAALGKRLMFRKERKINKLLITLSYREMVRMLIQLHGSLDAALKAIFELTEHAGDEFLMQWIESSSPILSKHVGDHALWIKSGYFAFTGDNVKDIRYVPPEKEGDPHRVIWQVEKCFLCAGMNEDKTLQIKPEDFGEFNWGIVPAGIFTKTINLINEYCGIEFTGTVRETKCLMRGDPCGEYTAEFYPKQKNEER